MNTCITSLARCARGGRTIPNADAVPVEAELVKMFVNADGGRFEI